MLHDRGVHTQRHVVHEEPIVHRCVVHATLEGSALRHVPLLSPGLATIRTNTVAKLDPTGRITGVSTITAGGPFSLLLRQIALAIEATGPDAFARALLKRGNIEGTASFVLTSPEELTPTYSLGTTWSFGPYPQIMRGIRFPMPIGLAVLGLPGDALVGSLAQTKPGDSEPLPCYSGHVEEDVSLEAPAARHFLQSPPDANLRTAHVSFHTHWSMEADTLHLHREFTTTMDTAICSGAVRSETASDLAAIRQTYNYGAALAPESNGKPVASLDVQRVAQLMGGVTGLAGASDPQTRSTLSASASENLVATLYGPQGLILPEGRSEIASVARSAAVLPESASASETASVYARLGIANDERGNFDAAAADFSKAIALADHPTEASQYYASRALSYWLARDFRPALRDFSAAVAHDDANADAYLGRGRSEYFAGRVKESITDFSRALDLKKDAYAAMWLFIAEARAGKNARANITSRTAAWDLAEWPGTLVRTYRGEHLSPTAPLNAREKCTQEFFLGELALLNGDRDQALAHFRLARNANLPEQVEFVAADLELARLSN